MSIKKYDQNGNEIVSATPQGSKKTSVATFFPATTNYYSSTVTICWLNVEQINSGESILETASRSGTDFRSHSSVISCYGAYIERAKVFISPSLDSSNRFIISTDGINWTDAPEDFQITESPRMMYMDSSEDYLVLPTTSKLLGVYLYETYLDKEGTDYRTVFSNYPQSITPVRAIAGGGKTVLFDNSTSTMLVYNRERPSYVGSWTIATTPVQMNFARTAKGLYGNNLYFAGRTGTSGQYTYSTDAVTWSTGAIPSSANWGSFEFFQGKFYALGFPGIIVYSDDLQTWSDEISITSSSLYLGPLININDEMLAFIATTFISGVERRSKIYYSTDGKTWDHTDDVAKTNRNIEDAYSIAIAGKV